MIEAEREITKATASELEAWIPLFLAALIPANTTAVAPDVNRATFTKDDFDDSVLVAVALAAWSKRYKRKRKAGYSQAAEERFAAQVREVARLVPEGAFRAAERAIQDGIKAGLTADQIMANVREAVQSTIELTADRTGRLLGPTAINDATLAAFSDLEADGSGPYVKTWVSMADGRVRPSHQEAHSDPENFRIPLGRKFIVGDSLADHPRDWSLPVEETINCRCIASISEA